MRSNFSRPNTFYEKSPYQQQPYDQKKREDFPWKEMRVSNHGDAKHYFSAAFANLKKEPDSFKIIARGLAVQIAEELVDRLKVTFSGSYEFQVSKTQGFNTNDRLVPEIHVLLLKKVAEDQFVPRAQSYNTYPYQKPQYNDRPYGPYERQGGFDRKGGYQQQQRHATMVREPMWSTFKATPLKRAEGGISEKPRFESNQRGDYQGKSAAKRWFKDDSDIRTFSKRDSYFKEDLEGFQGNRRGYDNRAYQKPRFGTSFYNNKNYQRGTQREEFEGKGQQRTQGNQKTYE